MILANQNRATNPDSTPSGSSAYGLWLFDVLGARGPREEIAVDV